MQHDERLSVWTKLTRAPDLLVPMPIFRFCHRARHPIRYFLNWYKWYTRPNIGDLIEYHSDTRLVVGFGESEDDLLLDDGTNASWTHCCGWPQKEKRQ